MLPKYCDRWNSLTPSLKLKYLFRKFDLFLPLHFHQFVYLFREFLPPLLHLFQLIFPVGSYSPPHFYHVPLLETRKSVGDWSQTRCSEFEEDEEEDEEGEEGEEEEEGEAEFPHSQQFVSYHAKLLKNRTRRAEDKRSDGKSSKHFKIIVARFHSRYHSG